MIIFVHHIGRLISVAIRNLCNVRHVTVIDPTHGQIAAANDMRSQRRSYCNRIARRDNCDKFSVFLRIYTTVVMDA